MLNIRTRIRTDLTSLNGFGLEYDRKIAVPFSPVHPPHPNDEKEEGNSNIVSVKMMASLSSLHGPLVSLSCIKKLAKGGACILSCGCYCPVLHKCIIAIHCRATTPCSFERS
jgi:hypothetical protein